MLIIKIEGGLGNQLLQYLFGISLARKYKKRIYFDISEYIEGRGIRKFALFDLSLQGNYISFKKIFNASATTVKIKNIRVHHGSIALTDRLRLLGFLPVAYERQGGTLEDFASVLTGYLIGYWVSFLYWHQPRDLMADLNLVFDVVEEKRQSSKLPAKIEIDDTWAAVHVRRGDYLRSEHINWYGICSAEFFLAAIKHLDKDKILFFSDDPAYIKINFSDFTNALNASELIGSEIDEFLLMRKCKNIAISNSTFSYVAALFSSFIFPDHHVVAPTPWFQWSNLSPPTLDSWVTLGRRTGKPIATLKSRTDRLPSTCAVIKGFNSKNEVKRCLTMLSKQSVAVKKVFIYADFIDSESSADLLPSGFKPDLVLTRAVDTGAGLRETCAKITSEYFIILTEPQEWSNTKLLADLLLATETNSDIVVSPFHINSSDGVAPPARLSPPFLVENQSSLRRCVLLAVMAHHGTALIRTAALNAMMEDPITEVAVSSDRLAIQYQDPVEYPNGFWSAVAKRRRSELFFETERLALTKSPQPEKIKQLFKDVWDLGSGLDEPHSTPL